MKTDEITVDSRGARMETALAQAEKVAVYKGLARKDALSLRLLTEEMLGLMRALTGESEGVFWIEDEDGEYRLHLRVRTRLNADERAQLLSVSSTGKNESAKGLMGRLRDFFDWGSDADLAAYNGPLLMPEMYETTSSPSLDWEWSMVRYEDALNSRMAAADPAAKEAWDELEKSVVTHVADDIRVSIRNGNVEMVILKKMG
ncbi:MAG: hypothetical protein ABTA22_05465 [Clostridia bacterium]